MRKFAIAAILAALWASPSAAQMSDAGDPEALAEEMSALDAEALEVDADETDNVDPWEGFNRSMFAINTTLDKAILVPLAKGYRAVTHKKQRKGFANLLANLRTPVILINDLLQGEFKRAGNTASRFVINTTIGFAGMGDPAERLGIPQHSEDFGQTLAVWGLDSGPYLYLPFFGPSTLRDGFGAGVGTLMDPVFYVSGNPAQYARYSRTGLGVLSVREPLIEPLEELEANSLDYYVAQRSFYLQTRQREIRNGRTDFSDLPDIGAFDDFEDLE